MVSALRKVDESDKVEYQVQKQGREFIKAALEVVSSARSPTNWTLD
jgi:hypothetical protein